MTHTFNVGDEVEVLTDMFGARGRIGRVVKTKETQADRVGVKLEGYPRLYFLPDSLKLIEPGNTFLGLSEIGNYVVGEHPGTTPAHYVHLYSEGEDSTPSHYQYVEDRLGIECFDLLDCVAGESPNMWNAGKYWLRAGRKEGESKLSDLRKMRDYINREIAKG